MTHEKVDLFGVSELYIVASPIGNLGDITIRAIETLKRVDIIACEDTRHSRKLFNVHGIKKQLISCNAHREEESALGIIKQLDGGRSVAYLSDAGTPGISDPGALLVEMVRNAGHKVSPIPGVSAASTLISVCGLRGKGFYFEGFLSPKKGRRRKRLQQLVDLGSPFVLYESPFRIVKLMEDLADICPNRPIVVGREMTKIYEEFLHGTCSTVLQELSQRQKILGEFSLLVSGEKKR